MKRSDAISKLADLIAAIQLGHPVRVGIDGVDCAGKTTLADELVDPLQSRGRDVIRASIDGFHNPRRIRHRQGGSSPWGYYSDSFNLDSVISSVLKPLGPAGNRKYQPVWFDLHTDAAVDCPIEIANPDAVLVFDGIFLHRPELLPHWDFTVFVDIDFSITTRRALVRDQCLFETEEKTRSIYKQRYIPGQRLYLSLQHPMEKTNIIFQNNDIENPELTMRRPAKEL